MFKPDEVKKDIVFNTMAHFLNSLNENQSSFLIRVNGNLLDFKDEMPDEIIQNLGGIIVINFDGDTLESLEVEKEGISFVTGFGIDNIVSEIFVTYEGILSILLGYEDTQDLGDVFINMFFNDTEERVEKDFIHIPEENKQTNRSMEALLRNNPKLAKKKN